MLVIRKRYLQAMRDCGIILYMKPKLIGRIVCIILKRHEWRRLRKAERQQIPIWERFDGWDGTAHQRICNRCGIRRTTMTRKAKP